MLTIRYERKCLAFANVLTDVSLIYHIEPETESTEKTENVIRYINVLR